MSELKLKTKEDLKQLLDNSSIIEEAEALQTIFPLVRTDDKDTRMEIADIMEDDKTNEETLLKFDLLLQILENSNTAEDLASNVEKGYRTVKNEMEKNLAIIYEQTKPLEKSIRSLDLLFQNAGAKPKVYILPVDENKFANSSMPKDFEKMQDWLREKFYQWFMDDSPFYISYVEI